tara:strand:- start:4569 stop:4793 length:225 start_codon:yes stop_codon:yes gene_type:complete
MENIKEIKSTLTGGILFLLGCGVFTYEYLNIESLAWNHYIVPAVMVGVGIGLLFAPDKFVNFMFSWAKKKSNSQ